MKLRMIERMNLLEMLPREGNVLTLRLVRELRETLAPTADEQTAIKMREITGNRIIWDPDLEPKEQYEIQISDAATGVIKPILKRWNDEGKLQEQHLGLWEKFGME